MQLDTSVPFYGPWDAAINPPHFLFKRFGKTVSHVEDQRTYGDGLIEWLLGEGKAQVIERFKRINSSGSDKPMADEDDGNLRMFDDNGKMLVLYKADHLIELRQSSKGWSVEDWFPSGGESVIEEFKKYLVETGGAQVSMLLQSPGGMYIKSIDFEPPVIDNMDLNYGDGFDKVDQTIRAKLAVKKSGAIIFHGQPGTGKSSYIKHLTSVVPREFIYVPVGLAGELASPSFITLLMEHKHAVLILEDAEQAVQSREVDVYSASTVSTLLNISDGVLGSVLGITTLITYNADKQSIDKALLRKGRLMFDYTFDKLPVEAARRLARHLKKGNPDSITEPTSLADVYNAEDETGYTPPVVKSMGFNFTAPVTPTKRSI